MCDVDYKRSLLLPNESRMYDQENHPKCPLDEVSTMPSDTVMHVSIPREWAYFHIYFRKLRRGDKYTPWVNLELPASVFSLAFQQGFSLKVHDNIEYKVVARMLPGVDQEDIVTVLESLDERSENHARIQTVTMHRPAVRPASREDDQDGLRSLTLSVWGGKDSRV